MNSQVSHFPVSPYVSSLFFSCFPSLILVEKLQARISSYNEAASKESSTDRRMGAQKTLSSRWKRSRHISCEKKGGGITAVLTTSFVCLSPYFSLSLPLSSP